MSLLKLGDDPEWAKINKRVSERVVNMQSSPTSQTMTNLQISRVAIQQRKAEIETALSTMTATKASAWQSALAGVGDIALEGRDQLRAEYAELEQRERFVESAIEEGRLAEDAIKGKADMQVCLEITPALQKAVIPEARAGARQILKAMETQERIVNLLLENDVRADHLGRVNFPMILSRETLEAFLRETAELG